MNDLPDAVDEFGGLDLGDARRNARARSVVAALQVDPTATFPQAMRTVAGREAFYRLVNNDAVDLDSLLEPHASQAISRMRVRAERPIIAIDKTQFVFEGEEEREDLEWLTANTQGMTAFFALALSPTRRTHGVLKVKPLDGNGRCTANEWAGFIEDAAADVDAAQLAPVFVMDQEADAYELFCMLTARGRDFVVRVSWDRFVKEAGNPLVEPFHDVAERAPVILSRDVQLARRKSAGRTGNQKQKHPPRSTRKTELVVRACTFVMPRPKNKKLAHLPTELSMQLVHITERAAPTDHSPVEWFLVTSLPIGNADSVAAIVDAYRGRWNIEEYFKALKTGCAYEDRQLESKHALLNALGLLIPLAWRLLELRTVAEEDPERPASEALESDELHVLRRLSTDIKLGPTPTIYEAMMAVASIGGHIKQNGRPGWQVLYRGFRLLLSHVVGYRLAKSEM